MQTDYFVKGGGASALAFVDVMLRETDASFVIVDKRAAPGGHWNDAYPFVRLHQPSANYGVPSRPLGHQRKDLSGFNAGFYELASGIEVADYFHQVMRDTFLPTGRVQYFPVCEVVGEPHPRHAEFVSLLSGERHRVEIRKKYVDATLLHTSIPLTHKRNFDVAAGVTCIPPNDLTRLSPSHTHFTVLGAGKTAIDSLLWLLSNGAKPERVTWVLPRDSWLFNRANFQPGDEFTEQALGAVAGQYEILSAMTSVRDFCEKMEARKYWLRLDADVWPTMQHGATVTESELSLLRQVGRFVRGQRVRRLEPERMILSGSDMAMHSDELYVDCTARALEARDSGVPVFAPGIINLQMVRLYQPTFSAALIAHIEATIADEAEKQALTPVAPMTDTVEDWMHTMMINIINQGNWTRHPELRQWIPSCRLDLYGSRVRARPDDVVAQAILTKIREYATPAVENLQRLLARRETRSA